MASSGKRRMKCQLVGNLVERPFIPGRLLANMAQVYVTKISAAQRQIDAGIRLLFSGEDSLAVHTITAAAHGIVKDLAEKREPGPVDNLYKMSLKGVFEQLSDQMPSDDAIQLA